MNPTTLSGARPGWALALAALLALANAGVARGEPPQILDDRVTDLADVLSDDQEREAESQPWRR